MRETTETGVLRTAVQVDGETAGYLTAEQDGPAVLLLHGTYWSRVWLPVLGRLAEAGLRPLAVDFPGLGGAIRVRAEDLRADRRGRP